MTQFGFPHAAALSLALIFILCRAVDWIYYRIVPRLSIGPLTSFALLLAATYAATKLGVWLYAPHR
jgi:hypothetical protein